MMAIELQCRHCSAKEPPRHARRGSTVLKKEVRKWPC
jgi:hypothetical protein